MHLRDKQQSRWPGSIVDTLVFVLSPREPCTHSHTRSDGNNRNHGIPDLGHGPDVPHSHVLQLAHSSMTEAEKCRPNDIAVRRVNRVQFPGIGSGDDELLEPKLITVQGILGEGHGG